MRNFLFSGLPLSVAVLSILACALCKHDMIVWLLFFHGGHDIDLEFDAS